jgi:hypothetical protein
LPTTAVVIGIAPSVRGAPAKQWLAELLHSVCFDCHANAHQNGATHLDPSIRPEWFRHRLKTVSLRGVNIQRLFGSQRALKTIQDFTEFEQRTAYFDGDEEGCEPARARGSQVDFMADFQEIIDFPPAPKLDVLGKPRRRRPKCAGRRCSSASASARAATSRPSIPTI